MVAHLLEAGCDSSARFQSRLRKRAWLTVKLLHLDVLILQLDRQEDFEVVLLDASQSFLPSLMHLYGRSHSIQVGFSLPSQVLHSRNECAARLILDWHVLEPLNSVSSCNDACLRIGLTH